MAMIVATVLHSVVSVLVCTVCYASDLMLLNVLNDNR